MINHFIFFLLFFMIFISHCDVLSAQKFESNIQMLFENLTDPVYYQKWIRPQVNTNDQSPVNITKEPLYVNVSIDLYNYATVDEITSEYTFHLFIDMEWYDPRLQFNYFNKQTGVEDKNVIIEGGQHHIDRLWTPTIFIPNNQDPGSFDYDHESANFIRVKPNGYVWLRKRKMLRIYCNMDFHLYPFDEQICYLHLESSVSTADYLKLQWNKKLSFSRGQSFKTIGFDLGETNTFESEEMYSKNNSFSRASLKFVLAREWAHHIFLFYIPSGIIVIGSWASFWLEITSPPARVSLGVTTMLALVTTFKNTKSQLPNVSYWNALDIWNMVCIVFIFSSLIEFAVVNYIFNTEKRKKRTIKLERKRRNTIIMTNENIIKHMRRQSSVDSSIYQNTFTTTMTSMSDLNRKLSDFERKSSIISNSDFPKKDPVFDITKRRRSSIGIDLLKPMPNIREEPSGRNSRNSRRASATSSSHMVTDLCLKLTPEELANEIDRKCRLIFPLTFLMFNFLYWTILQIKF